MSVKDQAIDREKLRVTPIHFRKAQDSGVPEIPKVKSVALERGGRRLLLPVRLCHLQANFLNGLDQKFGCKLVVFIHGLLYKLSPLRSRGRFSGSRKCK